ncbi:hypothetical protein ACMGD3_24055 [Lysinibacillus sphaericus]|uniref:hypothetical protein n=1 Tax=Lysinibacillus sphaericus TaxID=1421 RepID=UPI003F798344
MLKTKVLNHPYFKANVEISITPIEGNNTTACKLIFTNISYLPNGRSIIWLVTIPCVYENALEALTELTKQQYSFEGYSEVV